MTFELAPAGDFLMTPLGDGVNLYVLRTEKFKTVSVGMYVHRPLTREAVTPTALAAQLLKRGSKNHPSTRALTIRTEELWGAGLDSFVMKFGESQSVGLSLDVVDRRYLPAGAGDPLEDALKLLFEVMDEPATEDRGFVPAYFEQERDNLRRRIEGLVNDKQRYARYRCLEEMCPDEGYGLLELGLAEALPSLDPVTVYEEYRRMLSERPIDLLAVGAVDPAELADRASERLPRSDGSRAAVKATGAAPPPPSPREIIEEQDVKQGKLVIGYRTGIIQGDPDYPALLAHNGVLGGFVHSKLFQNVRERSSLAYYAHSLVNGAKGFIIIESGIEPSDYEKARGIIESQLSDIREGKISDDELGSTRKALDNVIRQGEDSPGDKIAIQLAEVRSGRPLTTAERLRRIAAVTKRDIVGVAERVVPDTVYFLRGMKGGETR